MIYLIKQDPRANPIHTRIAIRKALADVTEDFIRQDEEIFKFSPENIRKIRDTRGLSGYLLGKFSYGLGEIDHFKAKNSVVLYEFENKRLTPKKVPQEFRVPFENIAFIPNRVIYSSKRLPNDYSRCEKFHENPGRIREFFMHLVGREIQKTVEAVSDIAVYYEEHLKDRTRYVLSKLDIQAKNL